MIEWNYHDVFVWIPVAANVPDHRLLFDVRSESLEANESLVSAIVATAQQPGPPLVVDLSFLKRIEDHSFTAIADGELQRDVLITGGHDKLLDRVVDDVRPAARYWREVQVGGSRCFFRPAIAGSDALASLQATWDHERVVKEYAVAAVSAYLRGNDVTLPSSGLRASHYLNVKLLFGDPTHVRILTFALAERIVGLVQRDAFGIVLATSYTGSLVAANIAMLLDKPLHCVVNLGPKFLVKTSLSAEPLKRAKALLVADMICTGTEARMAQAALSVLGGRLVAAAALANYLEVPNVANIALVGRQDLEPLGYKVEIPEERRG